MRSTIPSVLVLAVLWAPSGSPAEPTSDVYDRFNAWCVERFGAEKEPLVRARFGRDLVIMAEGLWEFASESSAAVGFQTNLPAKTHIEYGEGFARKTHEPERHFSLHLHHLGGLEAGSTVPYRIVAVDERGKRIVSEPRRLQLRTPPNVIRIPGGVNGPPYVLDRAGAYYLVTKDLVCDGTAFNVKDKTANVTLDLGGHTVTYDNKKMGRISGDFHAWAKQSAMGLRAYSVPELKVLNGRIVQGAGRDAAGSGSIGFSPMYFRGCSNTEVAGVSVIWEGPQLWGLYNHWGGSGSDVHHNVFKDLGSEITNRHGSGGRALGFYGMKEIPPCRVHHNLVKRTRQGGVGGFEVFANEIYMDSYVTNSFAVTFGAGGKAYDNRVFGGGYHVPAFGWGTKQTAYRNFIHLRTEALPDSRSKEFGPAASNNGFRLTQYNGSKKEYVDNLYYENIVVLYVSDGRQVRGVQVSSDPYVKNYVWRDGVIKVIGMDDRTSKGSCLVAQGLHSRAAQHLPVIYRNNILITNLRHVCFGDDYGTGSNQHVVGCKFVKAGDHRAFRTVTFDTGYTCINHIIRDPVFEGGASLDAVSMGSGNHDFSLQWTLHLKAPAGTKVTAKDARGTECFSGAVGGDGRLEVPLSEYRRTPGGKARLTPHTVTVGASSKTLEMTRPVAYEVKGGSWREVAPLAREFLRLDGTPPKGIPLAEGAAGPGPAARVKRNGGPARAARNGNGGSDPKAAKLYRDARSAERAGMRSLARTLYGRLVKEYPDSPLSAKAKERMK